METILPMYGDNMAKSCHLWILTILHVRKPVYLIKKQQVINIMPEDYNQKKKLNHL